MPAVLMGFDPGGNPLYAPVASWISVTFSTRYRILGDMPPMHSSIVAASSDDLRWNFSPGTNRDPLINQIVTSSVLDFREAYGAAFEDAAKLDTTLVPTSCLPYVDATVYYNVSLMFGLYLIVDTAKSYLTNVFEPAWRDASVYRRHVAQMRRMYRKEVDASASSEGTPVYFSGAAGTRSL